MAQIAPNAGFGIKNLFLKISGGDWGRPPPLTATRRARGGQAPPLLGPRSRKPFLQIKIYHYPLPMTVAELINKSDRDQCCKLCAPTHALN